MSEWRSIDSAPRDGSEFLAYDHVAKKMDVCTMENISTAEPLWVCYQVQIAGSGPYPDDFGYERKRITHWMPLPEPPQ